MGRCSYYDPMAQDCYHPKHAHHYSHIIAVIADAIQDKIRRFDPVGVQRLSIMSTAMWSVTDGLHQAQSGPCGLMILMMIRCMVEKRDNCFSMWDSIDRGPTFALELVNAQMYSLGFSDREGGLAATNMKSMKPEAIIAAVDANSDNGKSEYRSVRHKVATRLLPLRKPPPLMPMPPGEKRVSYPLGEPHSHPLQSRTYAPVESAASRQPPAAGR